MSKTVTKNSQDIRKRAHTVQCNVCNNKVDPKNTIACMLCKLNFEYDCIGYSEKLHKLKDVATRKKWQCKTCEQKKKPQVTPRSPAVPIASASKKLASPASPKDTKKPSKDNTLSTEKNSDTDLTKQKEVYKINVSTNNSFQSLSDPEIWEQTQNSSISRLNSSCPDIRRINLEEKIEELENRNRDLQEKLHIAESEIDNLHLENSDLKKLLSKHENKAKYLVDIISHSSSKKHVTLRKKRQGLNNTQLDFSLDVENREEETILNYGNSTPTIDREPKNSQNIDSTSTNCRLDNVASVNVTSDETISTTKSNIYIIGDQQVKGLTTQLIKSRSRGWNDRYSVTGLVKPFASSSQILNSCSSMYDKISKNDILILSLGCNDKNPYSIMTNICNILCNFKESKVFLLSVQHNNYLNTHKLNSEINALIKNYANCTFINTDLLLADFPLTTMTTTQLITFKINTEIDYDKYKVDYLTNYKKIKDTFLTYKNNRTTGNFLNNYSKNYPSSHKRGTIPYYFQKTGTVPEPRRSDVDQSKDFFRSPTSSIK